jgi:hypothetical protein
MKTLSESRPRTSAPGRWSLGLGSILVVLGLVLYIVQLKVLKNLSTPWYVPLLGTAGVALLLVAVGQARSIWRILALLVFGLLVAGEWHFFLSGSRLPNYTGPVAAGGAFPAFAAVLADGSPFYQEQLKGEQNTVMVFFRGRW